MSGISPETERVEPDGRRRGEPISNVVSSETLRAAQKNPEKYRDLVVKVSGCSAYFCDLGRSIQEDIIARTEFGRSGAC
jgi:pyruvate-formate lyase